MAKQLRPSSAAKAIDLLSATRSTLRMYGRPRKRPNIEQRPLAVTAWGTQISPYHANAAKFSLLGAISADAKGLNYTAGIRAIAYEYIEKGYYNSMACSDTFCDWSFNYKPDVTQIDLFENDTREIIRAIDRAIGLLAPKVGNTVS